MSQAAMNGSNKITTEEIRFRGSMGENDGPFTVRAGVPVSRALHDASDIVDAVQKGLQELGLAHIDSNLPTGMLWTFSYALEQAKAAIDAANEGIGDAGVDHV